MAKKLHEVIIETIKASPAPPTVAEIAAHIAKKKKESWKKPSDGKMPVATQVSARVNNYRHLFKREKGKVTLVNQTPVAARLCKIVWNDSEWIKPIARKWPRSQ
ncbi:hypothetical protein [Chitinophaga sp. RAB17]|uniref:hypothetical protein n=1 Tax=Chitinophaga sp. RAB17 TaxID=3233049 RepID=UPI003F8FF34B